jgi:hypothetical protein
MFGRKFTERMAAGKQRAMDLRHRGLATGQHPSWAALAKARRQAERQDRDTENEGASMSGDLAKYNAAKQALAEAYRIDEVKDIRDKAVAMRMYAMQAKDRVLIDQATEIRLRAERRAGQLLKEMGKNKGAVPGKTGVKARPLLDATPKLSDLGINKSQSSRWQKLADIGEDEFEGVVTRAQQKAGAAVDHAQQPKPKPKPRPEQPKPKHPGTNGGDPITTCLAQVRPILRAAILTMDAEKRLVLADELRKAVRTMIAETTARDADADHWAETAH